MPSAKWRLFRLVFYELTHSGLYKAVNIFAYCWKSYYIFLQNFLKFVPKGVIDNKSALVRLLVWSCFQVITWINGNQAQYAIWCQEATTN